MKQDLGTVIREQQHITRRQKISLAWALAWPAIMSQFSTIIMEYIDASMVGSMGANASAAIGVVSSSTWLFWGVAFASIYGFSVQVAHAVGAGDREEANSIFYQGMKSVELFGLLIAIIGMSISSALPKMLGAGQELWTDASRYFLIFSAAIPIGIISGICSSCLQATGNMKTPGALNVLKCFLDVVFNYFFIFPTREISMLGLQVKVPGMGLGVPGAALGTVAAEVVIFLTLIYVACIRNQFLRYDRKISYRIRKEVLKKATSIGWPIALEQGAMCGAMVVTTGIVAPLGSVAVAANSFAITTESICYMPGYGLEAAATTLVGQSMGAGRPDLAKSFGKIATLFGMCIMTGTGILMYFACPAVLGFMTVDPSVQALGVSVLRIELWSEPFFAASIVAAGALRGAEDTLVPSLMNLTSIWGVRITTAALLVGKYGLVGVWIAMTAELTFRGCIFLIRLFTSRYWKKK
ncbi:MAG: MATE family efflux transporter [Lachnospiraceae bacterium]|nr:MATE family efflux transporter [Lachnospiraceae bacterium]